MKSPLEIKCIKKFKKPLKEVKHAQKPLKKISFFEISIFLPTTTPNKNEPKIEIM